VYWPERARGGRLWQREPGAADQVDGHEATGDRRSMFSGHPGTPAGRQRGDGTA
jgi:hypothetical protein